MRSGILRLSIRRKPRSEKLVVAFRHSDEMLPRMQLMIENNMDQQKRKSTKKEVRHCQMSVMDVP